MMTRKHFRLMADTISRIENKADRKAMAKHNAEICAKSNPRFDSAKFMAACGVA